MAKGKQKTEPSDKKTEENQTTTIEKVQNNPIMAIGSDVPAFQERYTEIVERVSLELPSAMAFQKIIDELPDEYADNLIRLIQRTTKNTQRRLR